MALCLPCFHSRLTTRVRRDWCCCIKSSQGEKGINNSVTASGEERKGMLCIRVIGMTKVERKGYWDVKNGQTVLQWCDGCGNVTVRLAWDRHGVTQASMYRTIIYELPSFTRISYYYYTVTILYILPP